MMYIPVRLPGGEGAARLPFRLGIVAFMAYPELLKSDEGAAERILSLAGDPAFDLIEIGPVGGGEWRRAEEGLSRLHPRPSIALGLQPEILVRGVNPSSLDERERGEAENRLRGLVSEACRRGYEAVSLCSGPNLEGDARRRAFDSMEQTLAALAGEAAKCGMPVYLETFDTDVDKRRLVGRLGEAAELVERVRGSGLKNVYLLWDLSHAPLLGEKPEDLRDYYDLVGHIHIGAAKSVDGRLYDWHPPFYRPGAVNDERDVARLLKVLVEVGYRGAVSFEIRPEEGQRLEEAIGSSKEALARGFRLLVEGRV